jgi:outer membrane protein
MRKLWGVLAVGLTLFSAPVARAESLADALIAAYRNSNLLEQNEAVLRAADEGVAQAVAALRPVIQWAAAADWGRSGSDSSFFSSRETGFSTSLSLSASLTLLDFGRNKLGIAIAEGSVKAARQSLIGVEQNVLLTAVQAYVNVTFQASIVNLRESNVRLITQELRAASDRFEVGEVTRTDVALAQAALAQSRAGLASAQGQFNVAREAYKAATGKYPGRLAALPKLPATANSLDAARNVALRTHPNIIQAQKLVEVADLQVALAKAQLSPTISGRASLSENSNTNAGGVDTQQLSLNFNQTIYAGGALASGVRRAIAQKDQQRAGLNQTVVQIDQQVGQAWANIAVSRASIVAGDEQIRAAQVAFDGVREEAALGARTTLDVLDAEQNLLDSRAGRVEAEANLYVAVYQLLSSMGLLTVDHLRLGVPTYDVDSYYRAVRNAPAHSAQGKKLDRILKSIGN